MQIHNLLTHEGHLYYDLFLRIFLLDFLVSYTYL